MILRQRIDYFKNLSQAHPVKWFLLAFVLFLFTALLMRIYSSCLITLYTPLGIIDLELAFNNAWAQKIIQVWQATSCKGLFGLTSNSVDAAVLNIVFDFPFVLSYTFLLIELVLLSASRKNISRFTIGLIYICLLAAILDAIENFFMLLFIYGAIETSYWFAIPSVLKFSMIGILILIIFIRIPVRIHNRS